MELLFYEEENGIVEIKNKKNRFKPLLGMPLKAAKIIITITILLCMMISCKKEEMEQDTIFIAAAASLEDIFESRLIPLFEEKFDKVRIEGTYDSSGKLCVQIEEGLEADVFMSAAALQMNTLVEKEYIQEDMVINLLENKLVFIVSKGLEENFKEVEDIIKSKSIALGDPGSVPVGAYAKEALTALNLWEKIEERVSFGSNVTEVLSWVAARSADAGIVYMTDVVMSEDVVVIKEIPDDLLKNKIIYPLAILKNSKKQDAAQLFVDFMKSDEALEVFKEYGFSPFLSIEK